MNLFILVEGKSTEKKVYKRWFEYFKPSLEYVDSIVELTNNNFTILSGLGYPQYLKIIKNACQDIVKLKNVNYFLICVDFEQYSYDEKYIEIESVIADEGLPLNCKVKIVIQNNCIESWFMGNKKINIQNAQNPELITYRDYHNVNILDPEDLMSIDHRTIGHFSYRYFQLMVREKGLHYTKRSPGCINNLGFLNGIIERYENTGHIKSFGLFMEIVNEIT